MPEMKFKDILGSPESTQSVEIVQTASSQNENSSQKIDFDSELELKKQNILDRKLNREQRERIARRIFLMMVWEVAIIGILLTGLFLVPFLNALSPQITLHLPPIFLSLSLLICYLLISKNIDLLPDFKISCKQINLKKTTCNTSKILKVFLIIIFFIIINFLPRKPYYFTYEYIHLSSDIIKLILYTGLAIFVKSTVLSKDIIKTLYELMKQHNLN